MATFYYFLCVFIVIFKVPIARLIRLVLRSLSEDRLKSDLVFELWLFLRYSCNCARPSPIKLV